jgi:hypothetical protein
VFVALRSVAKLRAEMTTSSQFFRIGTGAGFAADRLDPAVDLAERGALDVMVNVWAYDPADFALLKRTLTVERIRREFPALTRGEIRRYVIEHLQGLNFVMQEALEGGVNSSLNLDWHGKSWSYLILGLALDDSAEAKSAG